MPTKHLDFDESAANEVTISMVDQNTSARIILVAVAKAMRTQRDQITTLQGDVATLRKRLASSGSILATIVALATIAGQHLPTWVQTIIGLFN